MLRVGIAFNAIFDRADPAFANALAILIGSAAFDHGGFFLIATRSTCEIGFLRNSLRKINSMTDSFIVIT